MQVHLLIVRRGWRGWWGGVIRDLFWFIFVDVCCISCLVLMISSVLILPIGAQSCLLQTYEQA